MTEIVWGTTYEFQGTTVTETTRIRRKAMADHWKTGRPAGTEWFF
jgi:hypothetical protein